MPDSIPKIHDRFAKRSLSEVLIARDFLKAHLPQDLQQQIDLNTLRPLNTNLVPDHLSEFHSDVVYECQIRGETGYILALLEHQSSVDELMPFRKLQYAVHLMENHLRQGHSKLPVVVTLCLYNGKQSPYPGPVDLFDCFTHPEIAKKALFNTLQVIDLSVMSQEEMEHHGLAALMEALLQQHSIHHAVRDIRALIHWLLDSKILPNTLNALSGNYLEGVVHYITQTGDVGGPAETRKLISDLAEQLPPEQGAKIMTIAEVLKNEGMQAGIQAGMQKRSATIAESMLRRGLSESDVIEYTGLTHDEVVQIKKKILH